MLCRTCFRCHATFHVLDRPSDDWLVESHYCLACYEHRDVRSPTGWLALSGDPPRLAAPPAFPLSRFTIKGLMTLAGLFAILNAAVALVMRSGLIRGAPAQVQDWTAKAFLIANSSLAVLLVELALLVWLRKLYLHKIAGGMSISHWKAIDRNFVWRIAWEEASSLERLLLISSRPWLFLPLLVQCVFMVKRINPWLFIPVALPLMFGICILLFLSLVVSTRCR
jgi:hypothetical protein